MDIGSRAIGAALGQAVGDAAGFAAEQSGPDECLQHILAVLDDGYSAGMKREPYIPGQISDDTQCSLLLLKSLENKGGWNPEDYAFMMAESFSQDKIVGSGKSTRTALKAILDGTPWNRAGCDIPTNGAVMRVWPMCLAFSDISDLLAASEEQARITHQNSRAVQAAKIGALAFYLTFDGVAPDLLIQKMKEFTYILDGTGAQTLKSLEEYLKEDEEIAAQKIADLSPYKDPKWNRISPDGISTIAWSLWSYIRADGDVRKALCHAVAVGGDVDTTGALAGALSGAFNGPGCLPRHLVESITDQGNLNSQDITEQVIRTINSISTQKQDAVFSK